MNYGDPNAIYGQVYYDGFVPPTLSNLKHMRLIRLNIEQLRPAGVRQLGVNVHTALTGNPNVGTPNPALPNLQTAITTSETANNEYEAAKDTLAAKKAARDAADKALADALRLEANTCEVACAGDVTKLATTGFQLKSDGSPIGQPAQVQNLKVVAADIEGCLKMSWKSVHGAVSYEIETSPDPIGTWTSKGSVTKTRGVQLNSFTSGQKIWVRVRAFGASGYGGWSDYAAKIVP